MTEFYKAAQTIVGFHKDTKAILGSHTPITIYKYRNGKYIRIQPKGDTK